MPFLAYTPVEKPKQKQSENQNVRIDLPLPRGQFYMKREWDEQLSDQQQSIDLAKKREEKKLKEIDRTKIKGLKKGVDP